VVYTGHNEFLEERSYQGILGQPPALRRLRGWLAGFRFAALARGVLGDSDERRPEETLPAEVTTRLDVWTGLDAYHRDDAQAAAVVEHFASNLERMVGIAADHGAGVVLVEPVSNLKDFSPFKSEHPAALPAEEAARFDALLAEGRARLEAGEPAAALALFERARGLDPDYPDLWFRIGRARLALGEVAAAETALVRARDLDVAPLRAVSPIVAAVRDTARRHDLPLIELPELLAAREAAAGRVPIPGDELLLDHVHPDIPTHALIAERVLEALTGQGVVRPAASWGEAARRAIYRRETAALDRRYYALRDRNLGKVLGWAGKLEEAEPPLVRSAAVLDDDPDLHLTLGTLYQRTGRPAQAAEHLERAVALDPDWPEARFNLGVTYGKLGRLGDGIGELETALSLRPDYPEALYDLGLLRLEAGDPAAAVRALERARALRPEAAEVLAALGRAYRETGRPADAAAALAEGVRRAAGGREEARARTELAATLARQGSPEAAVAEIGRAIAADPGYAEAHYTRGLIEARRGRPEAAASAYGKALELDPGHAPAQNNLALLAAGRGDLGEARRRLERAVEVAPGYAEAWLNLGVVRDQSGDPAGAIAAVERAVELRPGDARFRLALGLLYAAQGRLDDARPQLAAAERGGQTVPPEIAARLVDGE
jgi:tetratricopeptide (TPR) repeat protein